MALPPTHALEEGAHAFDMGTAALENEFAAFDNGTETIKKNYILYNCYLPKREV